MLISTNYIKEPLLNYIYYFHANYNTNYEVFILTLTTVILNIFIQFCT